MLAFQLLRRRSAKHTARAGCRTRQRKEWDMNNVVERLHFWVGDHT